MKTILFLKILSEMCNFILLQFSLAKFLIECCYRKSPLNPFFHACNLFCNRHECALKCMGIELEDHTPLEKRNGLQLKQNYIAIKITYYTYIINVWMSIRRLKYFFSTKL